MTCLQKFRWCAAHFKHSLRKASCCLNLNDSIDTAEWNGSSMSVPLFVAFRPFLPGQLCSFQPFTGTRFSKFSILSQPARTVLEAAMSKPSLTTCHTTGHTYFKRIKCDLMVFKMVLMKYLWPVNLSFFCLANVTWNVCRLTVTGQLWKSKWKQNNFGEFLTDFFCSPLRKVSFDSALVN